MDKKTVFIKTEKGEREEGDLSSDLKRIMSLIDNKSRADDLAKRAPPSLRESWMDLLKELVEGGYIRDKNKPIFEPKIAKPKFNPLKMFSPKPVEAFEKKSMAQPPMDDLDFSGTSVNSTLETAGSTAQQKAVFDRARAEAEATVAKVKAIEESNAIVQAKAKHEAEIAARAKAEAEHKAEAKAKQDALIREQADAKLKREEEARIQAQHEAARAKAALEVAAREKAEADARMRAEIEAAARAQKEAEAKAMQEAARAKAALEVAAREKAEADARIRAEIEAAARAQKEAEEKAKAKQEAESARLKVEQEALRVKAELEVAAKAKAEVEAALRQAEEEAARVRHELAEMRIRQEADERARQEAKAARMKAEEEKNARVSAELAEANARAEAKSKALADARIRHEAEERARQEAEAEAERVRNELAESRIRQEADEKARQEAKAARMKAEEEKNARVGAELAEARIRHEAEEKARQEAESEFARVSNELAEAHARAEAAQLKVEEEAARARSELVVAKARAEAEANALAESLAKLDAQDNKKSNHAAVRLKADLEAATALAKATEEKLLKEAEAVRIKAQEDAAKAQAEAEEAAKLLEQARIKRAEQESLARLAKEREESTLREADAARIKAQDDAAKSQADAEEAARILAEARVKRAEQESLARAKEREAKVPAYKIDLKGFLEGGVQTTQPAVQPVQKEVAQIPEEFGFKFEIKPNLGVDETAIAEAKAKVEAEIDAMSWARAESEARVKAEAEVLAKTEAVKNSLENVAAEMSRLKDESESARRKLEENARRKAEEQAQAEEQAKAWAEAEHRAKALALLEAENVAKQATMTQTKSPAPAPVVRRVHRAPLPLGKITLGLVVLVLLVVVMLPYVYPLKEYISPLELRISAQLKQPVHIGGISASSLPPKLQLQNLTVGNSQDVKVGNILLSFDMFSLFSEVKVISNAELDDVSIEGRVLDKQIAILKLLGSDARNPVRHMTLQRVKIVTDEAALPSLSGIAELDAQGAFSRVSLHSPDNKLSVDLQSDQGRWQLGMNMKESALPLMPNFVFSDFSAKGDLGDGEVNFTEFDAHIFNGILLGSAKLNWRKGWQLLGHLEAKTFELNKMFPKYLVNGDMYGQGSFALSGAKLSQLADAPHLDGSFTVKGGIINGFDMVETAHLSSRDNLKGARTNFDDMSGQVQFENRTWRFRQLKIVSGALNASGSFDVTANGQLGGNFNAEIKMRPGVNALTLFGSPTEPKLRSGS